MKIYELIRMIDPGVKVTLFDSSATELHEMFIRRTVGELMEIPRDRGYIIDSVEIKDWTWYPIGSGIENELRIIY